MSYTDSLIGFDTTTLSDPTAPRVWLDSDVGFVTTTLVDPVVAGPYVNSNIGYCTTDIGLGGKEDSNIGYASAKLQDPASPYIMKAGAPIEIRGYVPKAGVDTMIKRWRLMKGGVAVPLTRNAAIAPDGFIDHVTIPTEINCGVRPGLVRTPYTGPAIISAPTIIENKDITYRIENRSALILINCTDNTVGTSSQQAMIDNTGSGASLYAEFCTFIPATLNYWTNSVNGHNIHLRRCVVKFTVDGFSPYARTAYGDAECELDCCYLGNLSWFQVDVGHVDGTHNDGVQFHGGGRLHIHGCAIYGYKFNALGTPALDSSTDSRYPQIGQLILVQHTVAYVPGYLGSERLLSTDGDGFPIMASWGGAPLIHHNWFWGGGSAGVRIAAPVSFGSQNGQQVDIAAWVFSNTWMDYPRVTAGTTFPYPIRTTTNVWLNGVKYPATTGRGWYETTSPSFNGNNLYGFDSSIPAIWRGKPVGVRVDAAPASVARA